MQTTSLEPLCREGEKIGNELCSTLDVNLSVTHQPWLLKLIQQAAGKMLFSSEVALIHIMHGFIFVQLAETK